MSDINYLKFLVALIFVVSLMLALAWLVKKLNLGQPSVARRKKKRLQVSEYLVLDGKNRVALVKRDDETEHMILLGAHGNVVVETNIPVAQDNHADDENKLEKIA